MEDQFTANGVKITDGLYVWDGNLSRSIVSYADTYGMERVTWDRWYGMRCADTGERGSTMNGERMSTVHPFTGEPADNRPVIEPLEETPRIEISLLRNEWQAIAKLLEFARDGITDTDDVQAADYGSTANEIRAAIRLYV